MPLIPNAIERFFLFRLNLAPAVLLDVVGTAALRAAAAAVRLGVFDLLDSGPLSSEDVARRVGTDGRATSILLDALADFGYLRRMRAGYANAPSTRKWLTRQSATSWSDVARFWDELVFPFWQDHFGEAIRQGRPALTIYEWLARVPEGWGRAQAAFRAYSRPVADSIAAAVPLPSGTGRLIDVGGGHGLYSIAFCRRHSGLSATVFDLPEALEPARDNIAAERMEGRVALLPGDYRTDELGQGYSVALLFSILHAQLPAENLDLIHRVADAMNPGGTIVVLENLPGGPSRTARAVASLFGLTYLIALGGQVYPDSEIKGWLHAAGFSEARRVRVRKAPGLNLVVATKR